MIFNNLLVGPHNFEESQYNLLRLIQFDCVRELWIVYIDGKISNIIIIRQATNLLVANFNEKCQQGYAVGGVQLRSNTPFFGYKLFL